MKISSFDIYEYSLPLEPLIVHDTAMETRKGLVIHLQSDQGGHGFGEIAPLPSYSTETLQQAIVQLKRLKPRVINQPLPQHLESLQGQFAIWLGEFHLRPSVQFGFETAVLNLIASLKHKPLYKLIAKEHHEQVEINGLLQGTTAQVIQEAQNLVHQGFRSIKLKVGDPDIRKDIEKVRKVCDATEDKALLRLDANQRWTLDQAVEFASEVFPAVEYIEEPFTDIRQITEFFMKTTVPVALDESVSRVKISDIKSIDGLEVLVIKPTILGGLEKSWQIINEAKAYGLRTVISSSFESGLGISALANLAGCSNRYCAAGLDTLKWFKNDLLKKPWNVEHGKMDITDKIIGPNDIQFDLLKPLL